MIGRIAGIVGLSLLVPLVIALALIFGQGPGQAMSGEGGLDFSDQLTREVAALPVAEAALRDGSTTLVRYLEGPEEGPLIVLVHGSGWDGGQFDGLARGLSTVGDVLVPDLRGHGARPERRGDVDYAGQMEDDLADLIRSHIRNKDQGVMLLGHSSGGGLVIRFANGVNGGLMDRAVLLAPFVQHDAPMMRENSGGWARPLTRRIVGLSMLNSAGITVLDRLTAIEFAMPEAVVQGPEGHRATTAYSWRLNKGFAPRRDWQADIAALPAFLLIAGAEDEAFVAEGYEPEFIKHSDRGRYRVLDGVGHLALVDDPRVLTLVRRFVLDE